MVTNEKIIIVIYCISDYYECFLLVTMNWKFSPDDNQLIFIPLNINRLYPKLCIGAVGCLLVPMVITD